ncbi:MAG TPA: nicotinate-nucleotide adenylyltransferase [Dehalococcoidia bacterium]|nr:nicotinate-nucleotide adenylyltransferase [Dehalococcoidia bacterium]
MRLGVLGGTFDPVHIGHLVLGEAAREQLLLDRVIFIPTGIQWRKAGRQIAAAEHRVAMARLAIEGNPAFELSTLEVERPGPSYTADTLEALQSVYKGAQLFFVVGRDALDDMPNWVRLERILEIATVAVAERAGEAGAGEGIDAMHDEMPEIGVSATDIRERVAVGRTIRYLVPEAVEAYIRKHRLYT